MYCACVDCPRDLREATDDLVAKRSAHMQSTVSPSRAPCLRSRSVFKQIGSSPCREVVSLVESVALIRVTAIHSTVRVSSI